MMETGKHMMMMMSRVVSEKGFKSGSPALLFPAIDQLSSPHWKFILSLPQKLWLQVFKRSSIERFCRDKNLTNDLKQRLVGTSVFLILTMNMRLTLLLLLHRQISMNKICTSSGLIEHFESLWFIH